MSEQVPPQEPVAPPVTPAPSTDVERAIADFDAHEAARVARAKPTPTPFSLRDVDRRVWVGLGVGLFAVAVLVGGPPWQASFWITLGLVALILAPFTVAAAFLWQRDRS